MTSPLHGSGGASYPPPMGTGSGGGGPLSLPVSAPPLTPPSKYQQFKSYDKTRTLGFGVEVAEKSLGLVKSTPMVVKAVGPLALKAPYAILGGITATLGSAARLTGALVGAALTVVLFLPLILPGALMRRACMDMPIDGRNIFKDDIFQELFGEMCHQCISLVSKPVCYLCTPLDYATAELFAEILGDDNFEKGAEYGQVGRAHGDTVAKSERKDEISGVYKQLLAAEKQKNIEIVKTGGQHPNLPKAPFGGETVQEGQNRKINFILAEYSDRIKDYKDREILDDTGKIYASKSMKAVLQGVFMTPRPEPADSAKGIMKNLAVLLAGPVIILGGILTPTVGVAGAIVGPSAVAAVGAIAAPTIGAALVPVDFCLVRPAVWAYPKLFNR